MTFIEKNVILLFLIINYSFALSRLISLLKKTPHSLSDLNKAGSFSDKSGLVLFPVMLSGLPPTPLFFIKISLMFFISSVSNLLSILFFISIILPSWYFYISILTSFLNVDNSGWVQGDDSNVSTRKEFVWFNNFILPLLMITQVPTLFLILYSFFI